jgi:DNA-binding transcriptional LysR family regulator
VARVPGDAQKVAEAHAVTLRIAATHALSFTFLPRWLRTLESSTTLGPVQLVSDVLQGCEALMLQGKVQFVLSHGHAKCQGALDGDACRAACIGHDRLVPVCQPDAQGRARHHLADGAGVTVPVLRYADESGLGRILKAVLGNRLERAPVETVFTAHLASVLRTMALDGRGVAWLPQTLVQDDLDLGRLVVAGDPAWAVPLEIRLYREHELLGRAAEAFWQGAQAAGNPT